MLRIFGTNFRETGGLSNCCGSIGGRWGRGPDWERLDVPGCTPGGSTVGTLTSLPMGHIEPWCCPYSWPPQSMASPLGLPTFITLLTSRSWLFMFSHILCYVIELWEPLTQWRFVRLCPSHFAYHIRYHSPQPPQVWHTFYFDFWTNKLKSYVVKSIAIFSRN